MRYQLQHQFYERRFKRTVRLGSSRADRRCGLVIRLQDDAGRVGFGEVAPLESFGSESAEKAGALLKSFCGVIRDAAIDAMDWRQYPCLTDALECARLQLSCATLGETGGNEASIILSAGLLQASELKRFCNDVEGVGQAPVWKLKIGERAADLTQEIAQVCQIVPLARRAGFRLRLDANEQLSMEGALRWVDALEQDADVIEFIEQPLDRWIFEDLITLAAQSAIPIALDESLALLPGWNLDWETLKQFHFVAKPSLGDLRWIHSLAVPMERVVISSVYETAIGFSRLLDLAPFARVPGLQTQGVFADDLCYPRQNHGFRAGQVDPAAIWDRLG